MRWVTNALATGLASCSDRAAAPMVPAAMILGANMAVFTTTARVIGPSGAFGKDAARHLPSRLRER